MNLFYRILVLLTYANSLVIVIRGKNIKNLNILEIVGDSGIKKKSSDPLRWGKEPLDVLKNPISEGEDILLSMKPDSLHIK